jgi:hypothetical protein
MGIGQSVRWAAVWEMASLLGKYIADSRISGVYHYGQYQGDRADAAGWYLL